jgi:hypothetical protein
MVINFKINGKGRCVAARLNVCYLSLLVFFIRWQICLCGKLGLLRDAW